MTMHSKYGMHACISLYLANTCYSFPKHTGPHQLATLHIFQAKAQFTNGQSDSVIYLLGQIIRYDKAGWYIHGLQKHPAANNSLIISRGCEEPLATVLRAHF